MIKKWLFIDFVGTLARELPDGTIWIPLENVIPALLKLKRAGFALALLVEQPKTETSEKKREVFLSILASQGVKFDAVLLCEHPLEQACLCRKPHLGLVRPLLAERTFDAARSWVIGDESVDQQLADNLGLPFLSFDGNWNGIAQKLTDLPRTAASKRVTKETNIEVSVNLNEEKGTQISTGIGYFNHMLEQLAKHGNFQLRLSVRGDLEVDEHHTVEDTALALGECLREALGNKVGIGRYGFVVPMDEAETRVSLDLSGRPYFVFEGTFPRDTVGELPTELISHFFRSFSETLGAALHLEVRGQNTHHMVESAFKGVGRALQQAVTLTGSDELPSTKGCL